MARDAATYPIMHRTTPQQRALGPKYSAETENACSERSDFSLPGGSVSKCPHLHLHGDVLRGSQRSNNSRALDPGAVEQDRKHSSVLLAPWPLLTSAGTMERNEDTLFHSWPGWDFLARCQVLTVLCCPQCPHESAWQVRSCSVALHTSFLNP